MKLDVPRMWSESEEGNSRWTLWDGKDRSFEAPEGFFSLFTNQERRRISPWVNVARKELMASCIVGTRLVAEKLL